MELAFTLTILKGLDVAVCLHTAAPVPQHEWDADILQFERLTNGAADAQLSRMLVITDGGGPDAKQRSHLKQVYRGHTIKTAVIVPGMNNVVKRGLMTALTWVNPQISFYVPAQLQLALKHVNLESEQHVLWNNLLALQRRLTPIRTLGLIAESADLPLPTVGQGTAHDRRLV